MAKKKNDVDLGKQRTVVDEMLDGQMSGISPAEAAASSVGIRLPHLCQRFLFQSTIFPFQRTFLVFGLPGSSKSSFLYWIYSLFLDANGRYSHLEVEDKDTPLLRLSLTKFNRTGGKIVRCESMDHFQIEAKKAFDTVTTVCEKTKLGKRLPFVLGIDSLTAKMTEAAMASVEKAGGVTGKRFADEARSLSDWFKVEPGYLVGWPFALVGIRHDKPGKDQYGHDVHQAPGGLAPKFHASYELLMTRVKKLKMNDDGWEGNRVKISTAKSSLGSDQRKIEAEIAWRPTTVQTPSGKTIPSQQTVWSWGKSTVETLEILQNEGGPFGRAVDELVGLTKKAGRYSSATLGIRGDEALRPAEMARLIEGNSALLDELEPRIGIGRGIEFNPADDLDVQIAEARKMVDDLVGSPYTGDEPEHVVVQEEGGNV